MSTSCSSPPPCLSLPNNEVHVWQAALDLPAWRIHDLQQLLADNELLRLTKFHSTQAQKRFIVGRGLLRTILGYYLATEPDHLSFGYGDYGKPFLKPTTGQKKLKFNLSHSDGWMLIAITAGREVGVDLERIHADFEYEPIAKRFFSPKEFALLQSLPVENRVEAFFNGWTRKEAYAKGRGQGIRLLFNQFEVSTFPCTSSTFLTTHNNTKMSVIKANGWNIRGLLPVPCYVGAVAVKGHNWQLKCWHWADIIKE